MAPGLARYLFEQVLGFLAALAQLVLTLGSAVPQLLFAGLSLLQLALQACHLACSLLHSIVMELYTFFFYRDILNWTHASRPYHIKWSAEVPAQAAEDQAAALSFAPKGLQQACPVLQNKVSAGRAM